ncbi:MAG TPA: nucleotide pyrophosphohydrolase [Thermoanaerobaculia bacterium]|nr:nucleotide pyrophosphohydrolase [Thermoanaerobaculia bacterium]
MTIRDIQQQADSWISTHTPGYFQPLMMLARLTEELGELSRAVSHKFGEKKPKPGEHPGDVGEEIGDLLFVLVCLANSQQIDLDESWRRLMEKLYGRDADRWK